ncbi:uncharacterized protein K460DRAFT_260159, partial [Cucurbitaria berberidis CBS 394.84]
SPPSDSSGDTLHQDTSPDDHPNGDGVLSLSSPNELKLSNLSIDDGGVRFFRGGTDRYSSPFHRGVKSYHDSSSSDPPLRENSRRDSNHRSTTSYSGRAGGSGYRSSRTWMSPDQQAQQEFMVIRNAMRRLFKNSEVAKWKISDYIAHREAIVASQASRLANQVKAKEEARISPVIAPHVQHNLRKWGLEGNFDGHGNLGRVLGEHTIWCDDWMNGKDEVSPWPSMPEMKWEGDDRAKTGVGRFLPLPREEGPPTLQWNQLPVIEQYPIDQVARIPTMEDIYLPVDDQIEPDREYLWSKNLEKDIDAFLES